MPLYLDASPDREVFLDLDVQESEVTTPQPSKSHHVPAPRDIAVAPEIAPNQILVHQDRLVIQFVYAPGRAWEYPVALGRAGVNSPETQQSSARRNGHRGARPTT